MIQTLMVQGIPPALNKYQRMHFQRLHEEKQKWSKMIWAEVLKQGIAPIKGKVRITLSFFFATRVRHDPDNYSTCAKFILDSLVDNGILIDDSFAFIDSLTTRQGGVAKPQYMVITMEEIEKAP